VTKSPIISHRGSALAGPALATGLARDRSLASQRGVLALVLSGRLEDA